MSEPVNRAKTVRRVVVWVVVVSFVLAAVAGIAALLGGGMDETVWRILGTTALSGVFSIAVLCCATLLERRTKVFGAIGIGVSIVTLVLLLGLVWELIPWDDIVTKLAVTGSIATAHFAVASLLLLLVDRRRTPVRVALVTTLALLGVTFLVATFGIWNEDAFGDAYWRVLGIALILAALGVVVVPVMSLLLRDDVAAAAAAPVAPADPTIVSAQLAQQLTDEARRRGISVDALVAPVFAAPGHPDAPTQ
ncbi:hypothetical protein [Microbacterium sp. bgisy189]|uniref:hypothetical protein n=1 Tax=Microbacterium sp. bgisy189 TaxID=3413798 RepID=UPI003EBC0457